MAKSSFKLSNVLVCFLLLCCYSVNSQSNSSDLSISSTSIQPPLETFHSNTTSSTDIFSSTALPSSSKFSEVQSCDPITHFLCADSSKCITKSHVCDHIDDCADKSDESDCAKKACNAGEFQCTNGKCISFVKYCDGSNDCEDNSDESSNCSVKCKENEMLCESKNTCMSNDSICNGFIDCPDKSDELNCTNTNGNESIFGAYSDSSDTKSRCVGQFDCQTSEKQCIDWKFVCDQEAHCPNGSDELPAFCDSKTTNPCLTSECSHRCVRKPNNGFVCECDLEFELMSDGKQCQTSQSNQLFAVAMNSKVFATHSMFDIDVKASQKVIPDGSSFVVSIIDRLLIWADLNRQQLLATSIDQLFDFDNNDTKSTLDRGENLTWFESIKSKAADPNFVLLLDNVKVSDLTIDLEHALVYFLDSSKRQLEVLSLFTGARYVLTKTEQAPISLVLKKNERTLYWLESGEDSRIVAIDQDGAHKRDLLLGSSQLGRPIALTLNANEHKLFWIDALQHAISSLDLKTQKVKRVYGDTIRIESPTWLNVFGEHVIWSEAKQNKVFTLNLHEQPHKVSTIFSHLSNVNRVQFVYKFLRNWPIKRADTCSFNTCSYLCLPGNQITPDHLNRPKSTCVCPSNHILSADGTNCESNTNAVNSDASGAQNSRLMLVAIFLIIASALSTIAAFFVLGAYLNSVRRQRSGSTLYRQVGEGDASQCKQYNFDVPMTTAAVQPLSVNVIPTDDDV